MKALRLIKSKMSKKQIKAILSLKEVLNPMNEKEFWNSDKRIHSTNEARWGKFGSGKTML